MRNAIAAILLALYAGIALAQGKPDVTGGAVVASEPGKAVVAETIKVTAQVTAVDKATRKVEMKGPEGKTFSVVAGEEVRNFDQIKVGDMVVLKYVEALTLELRKSGAAKAPAEEMAAVRAKPGEKPAGAVGRQVTATAEVVNVDEKNSIISLKGPEGKVVDLKVRNKDHFKVVKKGDKVDVTYTEALAIAVEPAAKPAEKKSDKK
ncbi:MAG TPA: hypothetical protein VFP70_14290 [Burkholderiales bacterium]|nr:hypothetical protein [Burkholderiales bacterium]